MPRRRSNTRLFEADGYTFKCWIDPLEAAEKCDRGELDIAVHPATGEAIGYRLRHSFQTSDPNFLQSSQSSISHQEMLLNVGLTARQSEPLQTSIERAQQKIAIWLYVWDEKATRVITAGNA